jgi:hypothetical protein
MNMCHSPSRRFSCIAFIFVGAVAHAQNTLVASPVNPDIPSTEFAPRPHSVDQEIKLAGNYFTGHGIAQDLKLSAYWYEKAAEAGDPEAQTQIGYFYEAGIGVQKDPVRAFHWYQLAAAGGLATAKVNLGTAYLLGAGVPRNQQTAGELFHEAARKGSGLAACYIGYMHYFGDGVPRDSTAAEEWFVKGAKLHNPEAEYILGKLWSVEKNHDHDPRKAEEYLRKSAASGYMLAKYSLGLLLVLNPALAKSNAEPITVLSEAANAGVWQASVLLGVLSRDGTLVPLDKNAAYVHFRIATLQGGDRTEKLVGTDLRNLAAQLEPNQVQSLEAQAASWYQSHHTALEFVFKEGENNPRFPAYAVAVPETGGHAGPLLPVRPD